ncbi:MAG: hypothetical protein UT41_C0001G0575 [Candidatus Wolfebacteria bacterium GW2011_GWC2_39_22]|uniref:Uncharacterized protein n=1 Tax=Candidatus Wolfebacteria bacterium GW2011_GWC2_39_22 TaxID=1619013 RepID=A0A0G0NJL7_9BACT|nr:MAG: hypothetical protein UT41_C0001G0575 [Candidatus Wolfebacteria bacterium GW2011_GWC2_39_22]HBI26094.1 hypothetical protein [Candidatus Wolfebacteria bacterium]
MEGTAKEFKMRIKFKVEGIITPEILRAMLQKESVGFDDMASAGIVEDGSGNPVWVTAWSGFKYTLLEVKNGWTTFLYEGAEAGFLSQNLLPDLLRKAGCKLFGENRDRYERDAFQNGWEVPNGHSEIVWARGSYGNFTGPGALEAYAETKAEARQLAA